MQHVSSVTCSVTCSVILEHLQFYRTATVVFIIANASCQIDCSLYRPLRHAPGTLCTPHSQPADSSYSELESEWRRLSTQHIVRFS